MKWINQKKVRFLSLYNTSMYIRQNKGLKAFAYQIFKFIKGERNNTPLPSLFLIDHNEHLRRSQDIYTKWIKENEPSVDELARQRINEARFKYRPLISILTPVYNTDEIMLEEMIQSIIKQTYTNWELCIVDGASTLFQVKQILNKYSAQHNRIKVRFLDLNHGISGNSNEALKMIVGEFTALVDHDDILPANALYEIVEKLNKDPELDFIYTDKDTITEDGKRRFNPLFKPAWSPDILFNANYLTHLNIIRTKILHDIGGFDSETDGAQDWDLFIRISLQTDRISHIPKVLYHWRYHESSSSSGFQAKPYAIQGQLNCVQKYLNRKNINAEVMFNKTGMPQVVWKEAHNVSISIIINVGEYCDNLNCLLNNCISQSLYKDIEVIIINRTGKPIEITKSSENVRILDFLQGVSTGYAFQSAAQQSEGEVIIFLDSTLNTQNIEITIHELVSWTQFEEIGIVGGLILNKEDKVESTGIILNKDGSTVTLGSNLHKFEGTFLGHLSWYRNFSALPQWCMAIRKSVFNQVGGFSVNLDKTAHIDFCLRVIELNYRIFYTPHAVLEFRRETEKKVSRKNLDIQLMIDKHKSFFMKSDPYSNPRIVFLDGESITLN